MSGLSFLTKHQGLSINQPEGTLTGPPDSYDAKNFDINLFDQENERSVASKYSKSTFRNQNGDKIYGREFNFELIKDPSHRCGLRGLPPIIESRILAEF